MKLLETTIPDVKLIEPKVFGDDRGFFLESYNDKVFKDFLGIHENFVQDNHSYSQKNVLRGLHYQIRNPQGKLVRVVAGEVYDVAVDLRKNSPTFGKWVGFYLNEQNKHILWIPPGFAHGFVVLSPIAHFLYKTTAFYDAEADRTIVWNDPTLNITWPIKEEPLLSVKDLKGKTLNSADLFT